MTTVRRPDCHRSYVEPSYTRVLEGVLDLLLLTGDPHPDSVLPSLALLPHNVRTAPSEVSSLLEAGSADVAIVDARTDLASARGLCRLLGSTGTSVPVVAVVNEGGLVAINVDWGLDDILLPSTGPAERCSPRTSVVTPCVTLLNARPSSERPNSEWACMSKKPGVTTFPVASIMRLAFTGARPT